jgi:hypothetical protein
MKPDVCEVHGEPLLDGHAAVLEVDCVEPDPWLEPIEERHFPYANTTAWGRGLPDPYPVRYCPECRRAERAWRTADGDWQLRAWWMSLGPLGSAGTVEEYILREAARARVEGAPLNAAYRAGSGWVTVDRIRDRRLRELFLGLD